MKEKLKRGLNLIDVSMLIMGSMIGSGIFLVTPEIAREVQTPGLVILCWLVAGIITILGALSYSELAASLPKAGGQYIFLKEAYNKLVGFLYGWTLFAVIQTGTIAAVGIGFAAYCGIFFKSISSDNLLVHLGGFSISTKQGLAIVIVMFLTLYNFSSIKRGALIQNIFTVIKVAALLALIVAGFAFGIHSGKGSTSHFSPLFPDQFHFSSVGIFFSAMLGALFAADAWNNVTFAGGEVINPQRTLPRALFIGTSVVISIYILANIAYLYVLPIDQIQHAKEDRIASLLLETAMGTTGAFIMAGLVMVSTFGCLNGIILTGARVYYAMANDGLFFKAASRLNKNDVPANALLFQGIWASCLVLSGSYSNLLAYVMFAVMLFYILTISGIFLLRKKQPGLIRPHKVWGYPYLPIAYLVLAGIVSASMLINQFKFAGRGLLIVLAGIPVYFISEKLFKKAKAVSEPD